MPITVFQAETILATREGILLALVGTPVTVVDGTPSQLFVDPLREALGSLGLIPASFSAVTDADLAPVADRDVSQLIDVADLTLVRGISGAFTDVDETISMGSIRSSQNRAAIEKRWGDLATFCRIRYGYGLGSLKAGAIRTASHHHHHWWTCREP